MIMLKEMQDCFCFHFSCNMIETMIIMFRELLIFFSPLAVATTPTPSQPIRSALFYMYAHVHKYKYGTGFPS